MQGFIDHIELPSGTVIDLVKAVLEAATHAKRLDKSVVIHRYNHTQYKLSEAYSTVCSNRFADWESYDWVLRVDPDLVVEDGCIPRDNPARDR